MRTLSAPPARGWPQLFFNEVRITTVCPACAGMAPGCSVPHQAKLRLPRLRGDGPIDSQKPERVGVSAPPARGWPLDLTRCVLLLKVCPACAGMAPISTSIFALCDRLPRLRGDGPTGPPLASLNSQSAPPARGWPRIGVRIVDDEKVCPARAGMAPAAAGPCPASRRLPRPRGDGPLAGAQGSGRNWSAPPARGWPPRLTAP